MASRVRADARVVGIDACGGCSDLSIIRFDHISCQPRAACASDSGMSDLTWYRMRPRDWCSNDSIQLCSLQARGALIEFTNRCHLSPDTGTLIIGGESIGPQTLDGMAPKDRAALKNLAKTLRTSVGIARKTMRELHKNGAISVNVDGVFFSPLLAKEREISKEATEKGRKGGWDKLKLLAKREDNPRTEPEVRTRAEIREEEQQRELKLAPPPPTPA